MAQDEVRGSRALKVRITNMDRVRVMDDGRLSYGRGESYALLLSDGFERGEAWRALGGTTNGSGGETRRLLEALPVFRARLEVLMEERARFEAMGPNGEAMWAAKQAYRDARLKGDTGLTFRAAELMSRCAERLAPAEAVEQVEAKRGPGRPVAEVKGSKPDLARIKGALVSMGAEPPPALDEAVR